MIRFLAVAALATILTSCGEGGEGGEGGDDDYEPEYTPEEWFPVGTWQIDSPEGFLEKSILVVAPPITDYGVNEFGEKLNYDPTVDYGAPFQISVFQPYTLNAPSGPVQCYHQSTYHQPGSSLHGLNNPAGFGALHDPTHPGPLFMAQYNGIKSAFSGNIADREITTTVSMEDSDGNWLFDYNITGQLLTTVDFEITDGVARQEVHDLLAGIPEGSTCHVGGFGEIREKLEGIQAQGHTTLDLPRQPLVVGREYNTNSGTIVKILSEDGDRAVVSLIGASIQVFAPTTRTLAGSVEQSGASYSVRNGVQYWELDRTIEATEWYFPSGSINPQKRLALRLSAFGMPGPATPVYFPDYVSYARFPGTLAVEGTYHYYGGCTTCIQPVIEAWFD